MMRAQLINIHLDMSRLSVWLGLFLFSQALALHLSHQADTCTVVELDPLETVPEFTIKARFAFT